MTPLLVRARLARRRARWPRRPHRRSRRRTGSPRSSRHVAGTAPGDDRLPGLVLPGFANAHSPRLPPGAARAHPRPAAARSGPGGSGCTPSPPGSTPTPTWRWPAPPTPRWRWPGSPASASSTTCTTAPAARRTPTRTRWARRWSQAAADAGVRLTLLDACYLAGGLEADGHLPLDGVQPGSPTATPTPGPPGSRRCPTRAGLRDRRRDALGARGAGRDAAARGRRRPPRAVRCTCTCPSSPRRTRPARRSTASPRPGCSPSTALLGPATTAVHATHLTGPDIALLGGTRHGGLRCARPPRPTSPTASARSGRCATPAARCALGSDQHAVDRPARGGPRRWRCTSGWPPGSAAGSARRAGRRARPRRARRARLAGRGPDRAPARGPTWSPSGSTAPHRGRRPRAGGDGRDRRRRRHRRGRRPRRRRAAARHVLGDVGALLRPAIAPLWEAVMSQRSR